MCNLLNYFKCVQGKILFGLFDPDLWEYIMFNSCFNARIRNFECIRTFCHDQFLCSQGKCHIWFFLSLLAFRLARIFLSDVFDSFNGMSHLVTCFYRLPAIFHLNFRSFELLNVSWDLIRAGKVILIFIHFFNILWIM